MKRLIFLIPALLITGCMASEPEISAAQLAAQPENQTRHFRPVHRNQTDWSISKLGKTLKIQADTNIKLSVRTQPNRVLIRESGTITGQIEQSESGANFITEQNNTTTSLDFRCLSHHEAQVTYKNVTEIYQITQSGAQNQHFEVARLPNRNRFSITAAPSDDADTETCKGTEIESPFNALGTLVFHADDIPLPTRAALAWYLTYFDQTCE